MMNKDKEKYEDYFEILELEENASLSDINQAYKKLKELYSSESMVTDPIEDEFPLEERQEIVDQIEDAYKALLRYMVEKDRDTKESDAEEEKLEDTAKEKEEEEEKESEAVDVLELEEEEKIINSAFQDDTIAEEDLETIASRGEFPEEKDENAITAHENEFLHEHVHIELPEHESIPEEVEEVEEIDEEEIQEEEIHEEEIHEESKEEEFEIISNEVIEDTKEKKVVKKESSWDESLFEKDIKEITKEITKDIKQEVTMVQKKPGDEQAEEFQGIKIKGRSLRKIREKLGIGIHEIAVKTKINYKILVNIEKERFAKLPDAGHLRWYLTTYAKALFLDPQQVADQYMHRYRQWKKHKK